ncbi:MAG: carbonic anhydrase [Bacteroidetes bacterium]|nr:carbonic anhydrase [Bacteroidota bacterium]
MKTFKNLLVILVISFLYINCYSQDYVTQTKESQSKMTPKEALQMLKDGNERFVSGKILNRNLSDQVKQTSKGQYPFGTVLSCIDSRSPAEFVFDQGIGDIFNARIAGNVVDEDVLGSLEFASKIVGAKIILVLGHTDCGAVKGAVDDAKMGNLTALLSKIKPAVDAVTTDNSDRTSKNYEFVAKVAKENVLLAIKNITDRSQVLKEMVEKGEIIIVGGMYDIATGKVTFYE